MSLQGHIDELKRKHQTLDTELHEALAHPSTDDHVICDLKRKKLRVKDQLARLVSDSVH